MFVARRRPLLRAAMIGGTAYVAGRAGQQAAYRQEQSVEHEQAQEARIAELEAQQAPPTAASPSTDVVAKLGELKQLLDSGALTQDEFEAAKQKLLA